MILSTFTFTHTMASFEFLAIIFTGLGLTASIVYYSSILRNQNKTRQRELILQQSQGYSLEYSEALNEVAAQLDWTTPKEWEIKYGRWTNPKANAKFIYIMRVYTLAGLLLREDSVNSKLLFNLYPPAAVISFWEQFREVVFFLREGVNDPSMYEPFEYLYGEAKRLFPDIVISKHRDEMLQIRDNKT